jgi:hypothetical protein
MRMMASKRRQGRRTRDRALRRQRRRDDETSAQVYGRVELPESSLKVGDGKNPKGGYRRALPPAAIYCAFKRYIVRVPTEGEVER